MISSHTPLANGRLDSRWHEENQIVRRARRGCDWLGSLQFAYRHQHFDCARVFAPRLPHQRFALERAATAPETVAYDPYAVLVMIALHFPAPSANHKAFGLFRIPLCLFDFARDVA
jgi:hypothetical protein